MEQIQVADFHLLLIAYAFPLTYTSFKRPSGGKPLAEDIVTLLLLYIGARDVTSGKRQAPHHVGGWVHIAHMRSPRHSTILTAGTWAEVHV